MNLLEFMSNTHYRVYSHWKPSLSTSQTFVAIEHRYRKKNIFHIRFYLKRGLDKEYKDV